MTYKLKISKDNFVARWKHPFETVPFKLLLLYWDSSVRFVISNKIFSTFSVTVSVRLVSAFSVTAVIFKLISVLVVVSSDEFICPVHSCTDSNLNSQQLCVNRYDFFSVYRSAKMFLVSGGFQDLSSSLVIIIFILSEWVIQRIWMLKREWRVNHLSEEAMEVNIFTIGTFTH